ncbi:MAG: M48 family metalloprotease [Candidatus Woesearchaeota archaeon]|jgi:heat shock protein HtpX
MKQQRKLVNFDEVRNNNLKSVFLFFLFMIIIASIGMLIGFIWGSFWFGLILALIFGVVYGIIAWFAGANMLLALSKAKIVTKKEYPHLYHTIEGLSLAAGIPTPKAYVIEDEALNAFATGRGPKDSSIVVTTGLLKKLNREELEGVVAHEMYHIKNYDIRAMMIAAVMVGVIMLLSDLLLRSFLWGGKGNDREGGNAQLIFIIIGIVLAILAPLIAELIRLSLSRKREYSADAGAAILTRYPQGLANALKKIRDDPDPLVNTANKATAHLYISSPFRKKGGWFQRMFSTHPPIDERISRLEAM